MGVGTEIPRLVTDPIEWNSTVDVIVVGFGIAGACAAISWAFRPMTGSTFGSGSRRAAISRIWAEPS